MRHWPRLACVRFLNGSSLPCFRDAAFFGALSYMYYFENELLLLHHIVSLFNYIFYLFEKILTSQSGFILAPKTRWLAALAVSSA